MSRCTLDPAAPPPPSLTGLSPSPAGFPKAVLLDSAAASAVLTPGCTHPGLGSSGFARRYSRNRCFFLFLRLLRCFSSPGSPPWPMDSAMDTWSFSMWVSPFRYPRIFGYLLLPAAFRSLSRLSSALSAKASTLRPFLLNLPPLYSVTESGFLGSFLVLSLLLVCCFLLSSVISLLTTASDVLTYIFDFRYSVFKVQRLIKTLTVYQSLKTKNFF